MKTSFVLPLLFVMYGNVQIPEGVPPGGHVPVILRVADRSGSPAVWIAVER